MKNCRLKIFIGVALMGFIGQFAFVWALVLSNLRIELILWGLAFCNLRIELILLLNSMVSLIMVLGAIVKFCIHLINLDLSD